MLNLSHSISVSKSDSSSSNLTAFRLPLLILLKRELGEMQPFLRILYLSHSLSTLIDLLFVLATRFILSIRFCILQIREFTYSCYDINTFETLIRSFSFFAFWRGGVFFMAWSLALFLFFISSINFSG